MHINNVGLIRYKIHFTDTKAKMKEKYQTTLSENTNDIKLYYDMEYNLHLT